jgi:hypothetical protein
MIDRLIRRLIERLSFDLDGLLLALATGIQVCGQVLVTAVSRRQDRRRTQQGRRR